MIALKYKQLHYLAIKNSVPSFYYALFHSTRTSFKQKQSFKEKENIFKDFHYIFRTCLCNTFPYSIYFFASFPLSVRFWYRHKQPKIEEILWLSLFYFVLSLIRVVCMDNQWWCHFSNQGKSEETDIKYILGQSNKFF